MISPLIHHWKYSVKDVLFCIDNDINKLFKNDDEFWIFDLISNCNSSSSIQWIKFSKKLIASIWNILNGFGKCFTYFEFENPYNQIVNNKIRRRRRKNKYQILEN